MPRPSWDELRQREIQNAAQALHGEKEAMQVIANALQRLVTLVDHAYVYGWGSPPERRD